MTKFDEYRERAYAFHKKTGCDLDLRDDSISVGLFTKIEIQDGRLYFYGFSDNSDTMPESDWVKQVEAHFGQPFPSLLEAQGWVELKEGSVPPKEPVIGKLENKAGYVTGVAIRGLFNGSETYAMEPPHRWVIKREIITHYKPIEFGGAE